MISELLLMAIFRGSPEPDSSTNKYPHPGLLIESADLGKANVAKKYFVLDARVRTSYEQGYVPGARWVDHAAWSDGFGDGDDSEGWDSESAAWGSIRHRMS